MKYWLSVIIIALGTFVFRYSFISGRFKYQMPGTIKQALEYVPVAVMATLVALGFFIDAEKEFSLYPPSLVAAIVASGIALKFKLDLLTIMLGIIVYWLADFLLKL